MDRAAGLLALAHGGEPEVESKSRRIYERMIRGSRYVRTPNFTAVGGADLRLLFDLYDAAFFGNLLSAMIEADCARPIAFRMSSRMIHSAGKTTQKRRRHSGESPPAKHFEYEIAVSTTLLFGTFQEDHRPINVGGLECRDRLEALQRIFEHELIHLAEMLVWGSSSCKAQNFRELSGRIFGHVGVHHDLLSPRERVAANLGIRGGDRVSFEHGGITRVGLVNRVTKRATILVEDANGRMFSDGRRYATYYVPVGMLTKEAIAGASPKS
jgi:hypothetical protein